MTGKTVALSFPGKSRQAWSSEIEDADLAATVRSLTKRGPTAHLLSFRDGGDWRPISANELNGYVRERTGGTFTAKDFRTLRGTLAAAAASPNRARADEAGAASRRRAGDAGCLVGARQHPGGRAPQLR